MTTVPYDPNDLLTINVFVPCQKHRARRAFMHCPQCPSYPCEQLTPQDVDALNRSPLMSRELVGLREERRDMILVKKKDGTITEADFDLESPGLDQIRDVEEVYVVKTVLVPAVVLRPKPKEERDRIVAEAKKGGKRAAAA